LSAYHDIKIYEEKAPELFKYVQFSIATDGEKNRYFQNRFAEEGQDSIGDWNDSYPFDPKDFEKEDGLKTMVYGLLSKPNLLDVIQNFVFVKKETTKATKIIARYMQFRAANKIVKRVTDTLQGKDNKKFGLVWHWQGSGKTYAMAFAAWKLLHSPEAENPSVFVMVDRRDMEVQIGNDFAFLEIPIEKIDSIRQLVQVLQWGKEGKRGIFLVTIEKFSPKDFAGLGEKIEIKRENVVVLADEVHRTHYGEFSSLMRSVFKNAFIFGFTGTPLTKGERNTFGRFSPPGEVYLDRYSMINAIEDGFTVPLSYEARLPQYHLKPDELRQFQKFEEGEVKPLSSEEQKALRRKVSAIRAFVRKPERIAQIARDLAQHFTDVVEPTEMKAMVVTIDRETCVSYKEALDKVLPPSYSEIVMTFTPKDIPPIRAYLAKLRETYATKDVKTIHDKIIESYKEKGEPKILIVTDMLITGFDAPNLWTMYLDKPLKEHRALQAIARTDRPFQGRKDSGLVVDYIGVIKELEAAFQTYEASDARDLKRVIRDLSVEEQKFNRLLSEALEMFAGLKREDTRESLNEVLNTLVDPSRSKKFETTMRALMRSYDFLRGYPFVAPFILDYTWLVKIWVAYNKRFKRKNVDELKVEQLSKKTMKLIQQTLDIKEIDATYPTVMINREYVDALKKNKPKEIGAAIDVVTTVRKEVERHPSSRYFINLSGEVERTYEDLRERRIETHDAVDKMLSVAEEIVRWKQEAAEVGSDKFAIYEAFKGVVPDVQKELALDFAGRLLDTLKTKNLLFDGWQEQRDVRRKVMAETRLMLLAEFKGYKSKVDELTDTVYQALEGLQ
jgi:type I restriction enzyme R subunit